MHPIERLRHVARADGAPQGLIASEAARAIAGVSADPAGLVMATRQMLQHHPALGAMWTMAARVLSSTDPGTEAFRLSEEFEDDDTPRQLANALDRDARALVVGWPPLVGEGLARRVDGSALIVDTGREAAGLQRSLEVRGVDCLLVPVTGLDAAVRNSDVVVLECQAGGPHEALFGGLSAAAAAVARTSGVPVWAVVGVGRVLPARLWEALRARWESLDVAWELSEDLMGWSLVDLVVGPDGPLDPAAVARLATAPVAPELLA